MTSPAQPRTVFIPSPLRSYTKAAEVRAAGDTLSILTQDLDRQFPGIRFRIIDEQEGIRPHIRFFVNAELQLDLQAPLPGGASVQIICAISGG